MNLFEVIEKRHSYRGPFIDQAVSKDDLQKIVEAGLLAPTGKNGQTTRFVIVDDPIIIDKIRELHPTNKAMQTAAAYIACIIDKHPEPIYEGMAFQIEDCAAAVENMLLTVSALGYASVWIDGWLRRENRAEIIGNLLAVPASKIIRILLPVGKPEKAHHQPEKMPFDKRASFNKYSIED